MSTIDIIAIVLFSVGILIGIASLFVEDIDSMNAAGIFSLILIIISVIMMVVTMINDNKEFNLENKNQTFYKVSDIKKASENKDKNIVIEFKSKNKTIIVNKDNVIDVDHKIDKKYKGNDFFAVSTLTTKKNKKVNVIYRYSASDSDDDNWSTNMANPANPLSPLSPLNPASPLNPNNQISPSYSYHSSYDD